METKEHSSFKHRTALINVVVALGIVALTCLVFICTPLHTLMPGYLTPQSREQVINFALRMDSLEDAVARQNMYVTNLQDILGGRVRVDTIESIDSLTALRAAELMERSEREKEFARHYEETEKYNLTTQASHVGDVSGLNMVAPLRGLLQNTFDANNYRYVVEIVGDPGKAVGAALEGTVLSAGYMIGKGYVVVIQHIGELTTLYTHCGNALKKTGDKVRAGEAIATVGKAENEGEMPFIHFELWHKGVALDPSAYIAF